MTALAINHKKSCMKNERDTTKVMIKLRSQSNDYVAHTKQFIFFFLYIAIFFASLQ